MTVEYEEEGTVVVPVEDAVVLSRHRALLNDAWEEGIDASVAGLHTLIGVRRVGSLLAARRHVDAVVDGMVC